MVMIPLPLRWFGNIESSLGLNRRDEKGRRVDEQDQVCAVPLVSITETAAREWRDAIGTRRDGASKLQVTSR